MEFLLGISQVHMTSKMRLVKLLPPVESLVHCAK